MTAKYSNGQIADYWRGQAQLYGQSPSASWSDHYVIELEIDQITQRLTDGDLVLDLGCANGYSSIRFASARSIRVRAIDYIPEMIEQARLRADNIKHLKGRIEFGVGDITALTEQSSSFDKVIAIRVFINLGAWERQLQALHECIRVLRPGGVLLLSEATIQGWNRLNCFREEWGLEAIPMPDFNLYLDEDKLIAAASEDLELVEICNFASSYYVGIRLIKPLLARASGAPIDISNPLCEWNRWCSRWAPSGDYGTQKLFVFKRRIK